MEENKKNETILKSLLVMALPIILANFFQAAYQLIDSFWVGRLGGEAVAAVSISMPIIFFLTSLGIGFAIAGSILSAQYFGAKNHKMVNHTASQTILMVVILSVVISLLGYIFAPQILSFVGTPIEIQANALKYLRLSFVGIIFNFSFFVFQSIMRSIGKPKVPVYIVIGTVLLNFILDPLFMFGWNFIPRMEISGVALATIITQGIAAIIGLTILFRGKYGIHLNMKDFIPDFKFIKKAFKLGLPTSIQQSARSLSMVIMIIIISKFGITAIASYGAGGNILRFIIILSVGLSIANSALVGQNIGAKNIKRAQNTANLTLKISFIVLSLLGIVAFVFAPQLIKFFVPNDYNIIAMGATFIRTMALTFGFIGIQMVINGVLQASGNTITTMALTITSQFIIEIPLAYILSQYTSLGIYGVWYAFPITSIIMAIITFIIYKRGKWKTKNIINKEEELENELSFS